VNSAREAGGNRTFAILIAIAIVLLPLLYVLSFGPVIWLVKHRYLPDAAALSTIYLPLQFAADQFPAFERSLKWYIEMFGFE
jgi:hypothetical protein